MRKLGLLVVLGFVGCAPPVSTGGPGGQQSSARVARPWPILTRKHVDLWLHGYAMILRDTAAVPVFRRGYREQVQAAKTQRSGSSSHDAKSDRLHARLRL